MPPNLMLHVTIERKMGNHHRTLCTSSPSDYGKPSASLHVGYSFYLSSLHVVRCRRFYINAYEDVSNMTGLLQSYCLYPLGNELFPITGNTSSVKSSSSYWFLLKQKFLGITSVTFWKLTVNCVLSFCCLLHQIVYLCVSSKVDGSFAMVGSYWWSVRLYRRDICSALICIRYVVHVLWPVGYIKNSVNFYG